MDKTDTSLPLDFPPLLALATEADREFCNATARLQHRVNPDWRAHAALLRDLTRRDSQALWLEWLARELGMDLPPVGGPAWIGVRAKILYLRTFVDAEPANRADLGAVASCAYFVFGSLDWADSALIQGVGKDGISVVYCPALDNPDAPDAPIRALRAAVLTVGSRGGA